MKFTCLLLTVFTTAASLAPAATFLGITDTNQLVKFDSSAPSTFLSSLPVTGLKAADGVTNDPGAVLVNFSYNPTTHQHYGVDTNANFYVVDSNTGAATIVDSTFSPTGFNAGFAHDSFSDKFLFASDTAENVLIAANGTRTVNPALVYGVGDPNAAFTPAIFGVGIDPFTGEAYFLDASRDILAKSFDADFSELFTVGGLGANFASFGGLLVDEDGIIWGSMSTDGLTSSLYTLNALTGVATSVGSFGAGVGIHSLATVPEPTRAALLGLALIGMFFRRRR